MPSEPPRLTIIAGANGCGKSTFTARSSFVYRIPLLDPDAISKALQPTALGTSTVAAARKVLNSARQHIEKGEGFAVETTLSGQGYLQMMLEARSHGFEIVLVYIGTERVEFNLGRIRDRVLAGGHNVPEVDVRRRYLRSFQNLAAAISRADTRSCSTTRQKRVIDWSPFSDHRRDFGSSRFPTGLRHSAA
jgi:predicted ABC-type ATPase